MKHSEVLEADVRSDGPRVHYLGDPDAPGLLVPGYVSQLGGRVRADVPPGKAFLV